MIHDKDLIHGNLHSGNILMKKINNHTVLVYVIKWFIGDLGISIPANITSLNNEIYGVIPYIAPEIFKGGPYSKASDIYSLGMIMWEFTTGRKPFANVEHDVDLIRKIVDGKRPVITKNTPKFLANLLERCWDTDPSKRPSILEIINDTDIVELKEGLNQSEIERIEKHVSLRSKKEPHPKAIFTSRSLSSLISEFKSSLTISSNIKQGM